MFPWSLVRRLRTWLLVRVGLWRGAWRRSRVRIGAGARFLPWPLPTGAVRRSWRYGLYAPAGLRDDDPAPLIVVLHGCQQRALSFALASGWTRFADRAGVRLLCPEQRRLANHFRCWNWFEPLAQAGRGELDVIVAMLEDAAARVRVDVTRVAAVGLSAGGALAALLAFHRPALFRAVVAVAAPPLLGGMQSPQGVMRHGLTLDPLRALGTRSAACAPLAIVHGSADEVVAPRCAEQLLAQALESLRRAGLEPTLTETTPDEAGVANADYRTASGLVARSILIRGGGHAWSGGPGGHPYCQTGGVPLTALCARFLRDAGLFESSPALSP